MQLEENLSKISSTLYALTYKRGLYKYCDFLNNSEMKVSKSFEMMGYKSYDLSFEVNIDYYINISSEIDNFKDLNEYFKSNLDNLVNGTKNKINSIYIKPKIYNYLNYNKVEKKYDISRFERTIARIVEILIEVSTGKSRIEILNDEYILHYKVLDEIFSTLEYENPNKFSNLWEAYDFWQNKEFATYASRRVYFYTLYNKVEKDIDLYKKHFNEQNLIINYSGWEEINKIIYDIKKHFKMSNSIDEFNGIGSMLRTLCVKLSDLIYNTSYHKDSKTAPPNRNNYKDRFHEYINAKLKGKENADFRKFSKSSVDLADTITHDTTNIDRKKTETAIVAIINLVNLISIIENKSTIC